MRKFSIYLTLLNASRSSSEHPPVRGENVKTFGWDRGLQIIQNFFMAFKRVPRWMVVPLDQQYNVNVGEKPSVTPYNLLCLKKNLNAPRPFEHPPGMLLVL